MEAIGQVSRGDRIRRSVNGEARGGLTDSGRTDSLGGGIVGKVLRIRAGDGQWTGRPVAPSVMRPSRPGWTIPASCPFRGEGGCPLAEGAAPVVEDDPLAETISYHQGETYVEHDGFPDEDDLVDRRLGQYLLGPVIGHGTMGRVYRAEHAGLGRTCALKVMNPGLVARQPQIVDRFWAEGEGVGDLRLAGDEAPDSCRRWRRSARGRRARPGRPGPSAPWPITGLARYWRPTVDQVLVEMPAARAGDRPGRDGPGLPGPGTPASGGPAPSR